MLQTALFQKNIKSYIDAGWMVNENCHHSRECGSEVCTYVTGTYLNVLISPELENVPWPAAPGVLAEPGGVWLHIHSYAMSNV